MAARSRRAQAASEGVDFVVPLRRFRTRRHPAGPIHEHFSNAVLNLLEVPGHHLPEPD